MSRAHTNDLLGRLSGGTASSAASPLLDVQEVRRRRGSLHPSLSRSDILGRRSSV
jgi:hypothetical protein